MVHSGVGALVVGFVVKTSSSMLFEVDLKNTYNQRWRASVDMFTCKGQLPLSIGFQTHRWWYIKKVGAFKVLIAVWA